MEIALGVRRITLIFNPQTAPNPCSFANSGGPRQ